MRIGLGMDQVCGTFEFEVSELWPGQPQPRQVQPGEPCEVKVNGVTLITGYVDEVRIEHDAQRHRVAVAGRDRTADLVDCSAVWPTGQWKGRDILQIARDLCAPFGIAVSADVDVGKPLQSFALVQGETVFEAIERLARIRALLLVSDGKGGLKLTRAGVAKVATALVLGQNVLAGRASLSFRDRYSKYTAKGQAVGDDFVNGRQVSQIAARAVDEGVSRHRPLLLLGENQDAAATLQQRVQWEANVRAARSTEVDITVQGWHHSAGLWQPNTLVKVTDSLLRLDHELLIVGVALELNEKGTLATLSLTRPDAFTLLPIRAQSSSVGRADRFSWDMPTVKQP